MISTYNVSSDSVLCPIYFDFLMISEWLRNFPDSFSMIATISLWFPPTKNPVFSSVRCPSYFSMFSHLLCVFFLTYSFPIVSLLFPCYFRIMSLLVTSYFPIVPHYFRYFLLISSFSCPLCPSYVPIISLLKALAFPSFFYFPMIPQYVLINYFFGMFLLCPYDSIFS